MSKASTLTFLEQLKNNKLGSDRILIYKLIRIKPSVDINKLKMLSGLTKIVVGARLSELRAMGVIYISKCRTDSDVHLSEYMVQENKDLIALNAREVRKEHFMKWLKKGTEFKEFLDPMTNEVIQHFMEEQNNINQL